MVSPIFILLGLYHFYYTYPLAVGMDGEYQVISFIFPIGIIIVTISIGIALSSYIIRSSILRGGFFGKQQKYELLAEYLYEQDFIIRKKSRNRNGKEKCKFPKVYYKIGKDIDEFTFRIGNKFHDKFLMMGKPLEEIYLADLIEIDKVKPVEAIHELFAPI